MQELLWYFRERKRFRSYERCVLVLHKSEISYSEACKQFSTPPQMPAVNFMAKGGHSISVANGGFKRALELAYPEMTFKAWQKYSHTEEESNLQSTQ